MRAALEKLDACLEGAAHLVVGGGAAMVLAYDHPLATQDVDAFAARGGLGLHELQPHARAVAKELDIASDWLNAHFESFTFVLPTDYADRLRPVYEGAQLRVDALAPEDLLVMKCFAARDKDLPHARVLVRQANLKIVDARLQELIDKRVLGAERAADYFDDLRDEIA